MWRSLKCLKLMLDLTTIFHGLKRQLFPALEEELGPLTALDQQFCEVISLTALGRLTGVYEWCGEGRPPCSRLWLAQAIICQVLENLKIRRFFDAVVTSEMVKDQKPAPDIFLEVARRIGVEPKFCRAYEDTDLGLQAIRAAGMEAVDVRDLLVKE